MIFPFLGLFSGFFHLFSSFLASPSLHAPFFSFPASSSPLSSLFPKGLSSGRLEIKLPGSYLPSSDVMWQPTFLLQGKGMLVLGSIGDLCLATNQVHINCSNGTVWGASGLTLRNPHPPRSRTIRRKFACVDEAWMACAIQDPLVTKVFSMEGIGGCQGSWGTLGCTTMSVSSKLQMEIPTEWMNSYQFYTVQQWYS